MTRAQFLIAAPTSGTGKTTVAIGLMALLNRKGNGVQPFKCGPDYIDTKFHQWATGNPSVNLDTFMASEEHVSKLYARYAQQAEVCIVEGMMGMFDGYDGPKGSSADIARLLNLPVILVIDAKSTSYSVAAQIYGFKNFDPRQQIAGVIFNRVGSSRHETMLRKACVDSDTPCLGCIRRNEEISLKSRYLGLDISREENTQTIEAWADFIEGQVDVEALLEVTKRAIPIYHPNKTVAEKENEKNLRIAVARSNESFAFLYAETLAKFRELGEVVFFNPATETVFPQNIDLLYIPGGYPEKAAESYPMRHAIKTYIENGGRTLAECGGLIFLSSKVLFDEGEQEFLGVLPLTISARKTDKHLSLGYRRFEYNGQHLRGHEFHYTQFAEKPGLPSVAQVYNAIGYPVETPVFRYKNVVASYTHLYLGETEILKLWEDNE